MLSKCTGCLPSSLPSKERDGRDRRIPCFYLLLWDHLSNSTEEKRWFVTRSEVIYLLYGEMPGWCIAVPWFPLWFPGRLVRFYTVLPRKTFAFSSLFSPLANLFTLPSCKHLLFNTAFTGEDNTTHCFSIINQNCLDSAGNCWLSVQHLQ